MARRTRSDTPRQRWVALALAALVLHLGYALWYLWAPAYFAHNAPQVVCVSALFARGDAVYHAADAPLRYSNLYGPLTYVIHGVALQLLGPALWVAKLPSLLATPICGLALWFTLREHAQRERLVALGFFAFLLLVFPFRSIRIKPDPALLACTTLALCSLRVRGRHLAPVLFGCLVGVAVNLKVHAPLYFLPAAYVLLRRGGGRALGLAGGLALASGAAVFAFPQVSLADYLEILRTASHHSWHAPLLLGNVVRSSYLALPVLFLLVFELAPGTRRRLLREHHTLLLLFCVALIGSWISGSKQGAHWQHQLPLVPYVLFACLHLWRRRTAALRSTRLRSALRRGILVAYFTAGALYAVGPLHRIHARRSRIAAAPALERELTGILEARPGLRIQMGYGDTRTYWITFYRHVLVFAGQPYTLDAAATMDWCLGGRGRGRELVEAVNGGHTDLWLIPRGAAPFSLGSMYTADQPDLFGPELRAAFHAIHRRAGRTQHFDLWRRREPAGSPRPAARGPAPAHE